MKIKSTSIDGVLIIKYEENLDIRGESGKYFSKEFFNESNIDFKINDLFYSISNKDVIRGMHIQTKPFEQEKLVKVLNGSIVDIVLDLRSNSKTFKKYEEFRLNKKDNKAIFIPKGCAHGFKSLEDNSIVLYAISNVYSKENDKGVKWDSFGYDWGKSSPIMSIRDKALPTMYDFLETKEKDNV